MEVTFDAIEYLSSLTSFALDKAVLKRIAIENELNRVKKYDDVDDETKDMCIIGLLEAVLDGPWNTASQTNKHGDFTVSIGQQVISKATIENVKLRLRVLYKKYDMEDKYGLGHLEWIDESEL